MFSELADYLTTPSPSLPGCITIPPGTSAPFIFPNATLPSHPVASQATQKKKSGVTGQSGVNRDYFPPSSLLLLRRHHFI